MEDVEEELEEKEWKKGIGEKEEKEERGEEIIAVPTVATGKLCRSRNDRHRIYIYVLRIFSIRADCTTLSLSLSRLNKHATCFSAYSRLFNGVRMCTSMYVPRALGLASAS